MSLVLSPFIFDSVFEDFLKSFPDNKRFPVTGFPIVDHYIDEKGNAVLEFALAGYKSEDLSVSIEGSVLTVSSDGAKQAEEEKRGFVRRIAKRAFQSKFTDRDNVYDLENAQASFVDGVLKIVILKKEQSQKKSITIKNII